MNQNEYKGILTDSVVSFVVRKGNPDDIQTWDDLLKPGVEVVTPNPFTSGGARWNVMAAYGAQIKQGKSKEEAVAYLNELFQHVVVQDASARDALQTFTGGKGDVLLSYENEAITAQQKGENVDYVIPDQTILIENPVAVTTDGPQSATDFVKFLYSDEAQKIFGEKGYRPVVKSVADQFRLRDAVDSLHHPGLWRLGHSQGRVLRSGERNRGQDRGVSGGVDRFRLEPKRSASQFVEPRPGVPPSDAAS